MRKGISVGVVLVCAGLMLFGGTSTARAVAGTSWDLSRTRVKLQVGGFGRVRQRGFGNLDLVFGPNAAQGLADNQFQATDHDGNVFTGTFSQGRGSRITLTWDLGVLETFLKNQIELHATNVTINTINIYRMRTTMRARVGRRANLNMRMWFTARGVYNNGREKRGLGRYQLRGNGRQN